MDTNWAAENLQAIRTLMEHSAVYRRALAPVMAFTGAVGIVAAAVGTLLGIDAMRPFAAYWMCVGLVAIAGDYFLVRRQALKDSEPFWSPPTRRVTVAMLPALFTGMIAGLFFMHWLGYSSLAALLAVVWILLYGCALHAAGFFMPRGMRVFAWILLGCGAALLFIMVSLDHWPEPKYGHAIMGAFFGAAQLAYGVYLYFTESRKNEA
jgi:hypothetical protein